MAGTPFKQFFIFLQFGLRMEIVQTEEYLEFWKNLKPGDMIDIFRGGKDCENCGKRDWSKGVILQVFQKDVQVYYLGGYKTDW